MKHLGFDTLSRVVGPCGAFLVCCALAFCLAVFPVSAEEEHASSVEYLTLDPEPVTGESLGFATAVVCNPSDESLWIGMAEKGLLRIGRNGRRIRYTEQSGHIPSDSIKEMTCTSDGIQYILDASGNVTRYSSVEGFHALIGFPAPVVSLEASPAGDEVFFLLDSGAVYVSAGHQTPTLLAEFDRSSSFLAISADSRLYVAGANGSVAAFHDGKKLVLPSLPEASSCLLSLPDGTLWAGTDRGLYRLADGAWHFYDLHDSLPSTRVVSLCADAQNRLWVATGRGLFCLEVSNSDVSKSEILYPEETFLPLSSSLDSRHNYYVGGVRGVVAVALDGSFSMSPWVTPEPDVPSRMYHFPIWIWILFAGLLVFSAWLGSRFRKVPKPEDPSAPIVVDATDQPPDFVNHSFGQSPDLPASERPIARPQPSARQNSSSSNSSSSPDELFQLLDKLDNKIDDPFVMSVYATIRQSYTDSKLSVEDIAQRHNLTRVHVNRKLQASLGVSPSLLLKAYRMRLASSMLLQGDVPVAEIAARTGFSSGSYFSSAFKDFFGLSPSEYVVSRISGANK